MYEQVMGERFSRLAPEIQAFHHLAGKHALHGRVEVNAPTTFLAKLLATLLGTPRSASQGEIRFELDAHPESETWTRHFPSKTMRSRLQLVDGQLVENLGAARLMFELTENQGQLNMHLCHLYFLGIPCPAWLLPQVLAEETGGDGRLHFRVRAEVPGVGLIAGYHGHLTLPEGPAL